MKKKGFHSNKNSWMLRRDKVGLRAKQDIQGTRYAAQQGANI
jgi:hypothetical protein